jgi:hypothetical protein
MTESPTVGTPDGLHEVAALHFPPDPAAVLVTAKTPATLTNSTKNKLVRFINVYSLKNKVNADNLVSAF